jgi:predicted amidohydrolase
MNALLAQIAPEAGSPEGSARRAAAAIEANPAVDLAVFPELYLGGYRLDDLDSIACDRDGAELGEIGAACAARRTAAIVGFAERVAPRPYNAVACFDRSGELRAVSRKVQLFGAEARAFAPGERMTVVELAGRKVAPLICFDLEFPELARSAALAGADLLIAASANMHPFGHEHLVHCQARALENRLPLLYVNRCGEEAGISFVGESRAVGSDGVVLVQAGAAETQTTVAVGAAGADDERVDYLGFDPRRVPVDVVP